MKNFSAYKLHSVLLLLLPAFGFSQARTTDDVSSNISGSGIVYDNASQKPLSGAKVTITNSGRSNKVTNRTTDPRGSYSFSVPAGLDIEVEVTMAGYKKAKTKLNKDELVQRKGIVPPIYLDTTIKIEIKPSAPVRQSKEEFVERKLLVNDVLPTPDAYDLLVYLNPDLKSRDSLMSNDNIIFPKMPRISKSVKRANKNPFQDAARKDNTMQNRLRDTIDKVARILSDDITRYPVKYQNTSAASMKQMRDYIRMDLVDFRSRVSKTSRLKAEGLIELLSKMGQLQEIMISQRALTALTYENMKMVWEDLSYLLETKRYMLFTKSMDILMPVLPKGFITAAYSYPGFAKVDETLESTSASVIEKAVENTTPPFEQDEVGFFGFLIWSEKLTSSTKPDLSEPGGRYLIRYFKPALASDTSRYQLCSGSANVATANLTRARYGIEVYDTREKRVVPTVYKTFTTDPAFESSKYDAWFTPDFKEIKYILVYLK